MFFKSRPSEEGLLGALDYRGEVNSMIRIWLPLLRRRQKTMQVDATVFTCISMLSRAMGPSIQPDIKELLEPMLAVGLR